MGYTVPTSRPERLTAGTTWTWSEVVANYPPSEGWTLKSTFLGAASSFEIEATARTTDYLVDATPDATAEYAAGTYKVVRTVERNGGEERYQVDAGYVVVDPDPGTVEDGAQQTHAEKMLASIEAQLLKRASEDLSSYSVMGRSAQREAIKDLERQRVKYSLEVWRERNPGKAYPTREVVFAPI